LPANDVPHNTGKCCIFRPLELGAKQKNSDLKLMSTVNSNFSLSPLTGKTILVTRSLGQSNQFSDRLTAAGATVIEMPALEIGPPSSWEALDQAISHLSTFNWLILTSSNGVEYFFQRLEKSGQSKNALAGVKIAVVGEKTAKSLQKQNIQADFIPPNFVADSLVENFPESLTAKKILFPRVESGGRQVLVKQLTIKGAEIIEVPAYESCCPQNIPPAAEYALVNNTIDIITFASSKTVQFFSQLTKHIFTYNPENLARIYIASIGPQTSKTCENVFGRVDIEAEEYTLEGLTNAIIKFSNNN
jgi:uroporphyrinogen-III synthase